MQQHSPFAPVIAQLHRVCGWHADDPTEVRLHQLEQVLTAVALPLPEVVPLLATLVSLPLPPCYPPLALLSQQQKQQTIGILIRWLLQEASRHPVLLVVEDLHWIDPSTLELLNALIDQVPAAALYVLGTCRPEFLDPWLSRTYCIQLTLTRLAPPHVATMVTGVVGGKRLPPAVVQQVVRQTDGVPLFVEELTKMVLESPLIEEQTDHYVLQQPLPALVIPTTLQDSLLACLDRLGTAKTVAQVGALIGREFPYTLLQAIVPQDEPALHQDLARLVHAELLYQTGVPPQVTYRFKHALIQEAAAQSLLRRTRQQYHRQMAEVLTAHFPETVATQHEVLAQHYTEAGLMEQAIAYWQRAGQHASDRSAYLEAVSHLSTGIELLKTLPETLEHTQQALTLHLTLGTALQVVKGQAAPEVEHAYTQAYALCQQVGKTSELAQALFGLWRFYLGRTQFHMARELGGALLHLAQRTHDPVLTGVAHYALGLPRFFHGVLPTARMHLEEAVACSTPDQRYASWSRMGHDPGIACLAYGAMTLWLLGYPAQALARVHDALALAHELSHPYSLTFALNFSAFVYQFRRDVPAVHAQAEAAVTLSTKQGFPQGVIGGTILHGWALAMQGQGEEGKTRVRQGIVSGWATEAALYIPYYWTLLAEVCDHLGHTGDGLQALAEAGALVEQHEAHYWEAEVYRLRGVLLLRQTEPPQGEAETWLRRALEVARRQEAKSLELRAARSLARLWQQQGKRVEARQLLGAVYGWFTEGFDTVDLQVAQRLLAVLA